jgi:hypothetical protein
MIAALGIVVIAMLPPPAVPLTGPLCESATMFEAADRLLRAFLFSALYTIHVYCSPPSRNSIHDLVVCVMRSSAAAVWTLGCHLFILWLPILQAVVALFSRFGSEGNANVYSSVDTHSDSGLSDAELGAMSDMQLPRDADGVLIPPYLREAPLQAARNGYPKNEPSDTPSPPGVLGAGLSRCTPSPADGVPVDARQLSALVGHGGSAMSKSRMAQIAAHL